MDGCQAQLVVGGLLQLLMVVHQVLLVVLLMSNMEQQPDLELVLRAF